MIHNDISFNLDSEVDVVHFEEYIKLRQKLNPTDEIDSSTSEKAYEQSFDIVMKN